MATLGKIISSRPFTGPNGEQYTQLKVDQGGGATVLVALAHTSNTESVPLPNDVALVHETKRNGGPAASATFMPAEAPVAGPGEWRAVARTEDDGVVSEVYVKSDGSVLIANPEGSVELSADGSCTITTPAGANTFNTDGSVAFSNGAQIDATGDFITASGISVNFHTHIGNLGAQTGPALP